MADYVIPPPKPEIVFKNYSDNLLSPDLPCVYENPAADAAIDRYDTIGAIVYQLRGPELFNKWRLFVYEVYNIMKGVPEILPPSVNALTNTIKRLQRLSEDEHFYIPSESDTKFQFYYMPGGQDVNVEKLEAHRFVVFIRDHPILRRLFYPNAKPTAICGTYPHWGPLLENLRSGTSVAIMDDLVRQSRAVNSNYYRLSTLSPSEMDFSALGQFLATHPNPKESFLKPARDVAVEVAATLQIPISFDSVTHFCMAVNTSRLGYVYWNIQDEVGANPQDNVRPEVYPENFFTYIYPYRDMITGRMLLPVVMSKSLSYVLATNIRTEIAQENARITAEQVEQQIEQGISPRIAQEIAQQSATTSWPSWITSLSYECASVAATSGNTSFTTQGARNALTFLLFVYGRKLTGRAVPFGNLYFSQDPPFSVPYDVAQSFVGGDLSSMSTEDRTAVYFENVDTLWKQLLSKVCEQTIARVRASSPGFGTLWFEEDLQHILYSANMDDLTYLLSVHEPAYRLFAEVPPNSYPENPLVSYQTSDVWMVTPSGNALAVLESEYYDVVFKQLFDNESGSWKFLQEDAVEILPTVNRTLWMSYIQDVRRYVTPYRDLYGLHTFTSTDAFPDGLVPSFMPKYFWISDIHPPLPRGKVARDFPRLFYTTTFNNQTSNLPVFQFAPVVDTTLSKSSPIFSALNAVNSWPTLGGHRKYGPYGLAKYSIVRYRLEADTTFGAFPRYGLLLGSCMRNQQYDSSPRYASIYPLFPSPNFVQERDKGSLRSITYERNGVNTSLGMCVSVPWASVRPIWPTHLMLFGNNEEVPTSLPYTFSDHLVQYLEDSQSVFTDATAIVSRDNVDRYGNIIQGIMKDLSGEDEFDKTKGAFDKIEGLLWNLVKTSSTISDPGYKCVSALLESLTIVMRRARDLDFPFSVPQILVDGVKAALLYAWDIRLPLSQEMFTNLLQLVSTSITRQRSHETLHPMVNEYLRGMQMDFLKNLAAYGHFKEYYQILQGESTMRMRTRCNGYLEGGSLADLYDQSPFLQETFVVQQVQMLEENVANQKQALEWRANFSQSGIEERAAGMELDENERFRAQKKKWQDPQFVSPLSTFSLDEVQMCDIMRLIVYFCGEPCATSPISILATSLIDQSAENEERMAQYGRMMRIWAQAVSYEFSPDAQQFRVQFDYHAWVRKLINAYLWAFDSAFSGSRTAAEPVYAVHWVGTSNDFVNPLSAYSSSAFEVPEPGKDIVPLFGNMLPMTYADFAQGLVFTRAMGVSPENKNTSYEPYKVLRDFLLQRMQPIASPKGEHPETERLYTLFFSGEHVQHFTVWGYQYLPTRASQSTLTQSGEALRSALLQEELDEWEKFIYSAQSLWLEADYEGAQYPARGEMAGGAPAYQEARAEPEPRGRKRGRTPSDDEEAQRGPPGRR